MSQKKTYWPELDIVRGIAVIMMLTNHAAVRWLNSYGNDNGVSGILSFLGSFAPVIFFFVTGLGYGVSHRLGDNGDYKHVLFKAAILIVMDGFMRHRLTIIDGWDFLAFIAFSMLVLQIIKGRQNAALKALFAAVSFALLRFIGAQLYKNLELKETWLKAAIGMHGVEGISYWFAPWLTYPFVGFIIGVLIVKCDDFIQQKKLFFITSAAIIGTITGLVSFYLYKKGAIYFRWGTMSINYFIISFTVIAFSLVIAFLFTIFTKVSRFMHAISMRGISSLAVVPIHYFILGLIDILEPGYMKPVLFYFILPFWLLVCMFLAKLLNRCTTNLSGRLSPGSGWYLLPILIVSVIVLSLKVNVLTAEIVTLAAQLTLCLLLACSLKVFKYYNSKLSKNS